MNEEERLAIYVRYTKHPVSYLAPKTRTHHVPEQAEWLNNTLQHKHTLLHLQPIEQDTHTNTLTRLAGLTLCFQPQVRHFRNDWNTV